MTAISESAGWGPASWWPRSNSDGSRDTNKSPSFSEDWRRWFLLSRRLSNQGRHRKVGYARAATFNGESGDSSPEQLGPEQVRQYLLHLINDKHDTWNTIQVYRGALKFLYVRVLKQSWFDQEIAVPKRRLQLPIVLSPEQIAHILDRTSNLKHWTIISTFYATALRCDELRHLKVGDTESQR